ncbi:thioredoxin family protein [Pedobacter foliorum]|uniref:TlpA family protein disulfide reductase n=1 Tax=Pedobacter foliorum TaxID=2739058 RepID=UPI001567BF53|nr:thioredoxin family protein [Pedobacter foliorum]NRF37216.1 hypothetical protein [Pedobacter foliorum]
MKTSILTLICFAFSIVCHGKQLNDSVLVNATFNDSSFLDKKPELVVQKNGANNIVRIDPLDKTGRILKFRFKKDDYLVGGLIFNDGKSRSLPFFISPQSTEISFDVTFEKGSSLGRIDNLKGSKLHDDYLRFNKEGQNIHDSIRIVQSKKYKDFEKNFNRLDITNERMTLYDEANFRFYKNALKNSIYYAPMVYWILVQSIDNWSVSQFKELLSVTPPANAKEYHDKLVESLKIKVEAMKSEDYKNILLKNSELAQAIKKSNKKFVYISLWASWCVPCRAHSKELLKADLRNIEVIVLSLDKDNNAMKKAIEADKIGIWQHIQLKEGFDAEIVKRFGITSIPGNILLDENRNVVGINISDNALTSIIIKNTVIYNKASKSF